MNATMDVTTSDTRPTAQSAHLRPDLQRLAGWTNVKSIDATMPQRPAESQPASVFRLAGSSATPSKLHWPSACSPPANGPSDIAKKVIQFGMGAAVQRAWQAATNRTAPVRMHVEWNGDVAAVWVGIDPCAETDLPGLIGCLAETFSRSGLRLRSVVCNGNRCFDGEATTANDETRLKPVDIFMESES